MLQHLHAISGGTTTYVTPPELLVKSDPYNRKNPLAPRTSDMSYLVLRSAQEQVDPTEEKARYTFNVDWVPPLGTKKYMVCLEAFINDATVEDLADVPYTVGWSYRAENAFDSAGVPEAPIAVGLGNKIQNSLPYGASFTATGGEPLGIVQVVLRDADGVQLTVRPKFMLSLYLLPID